MNPTDRAMATPTIAAMGDRALLLRWPQRVDAGINQQVHACAHHLRTDRPIWLEDVVPAYASLAVLLDLDAFSMSSTPLDVAADWLRQRLAMRWMEVTPGAEREIEVPVHYGGDDGPDLQQVAMLTGFPMEEVVARHSAPLYQVAMLGFAPGFPYLLGLDPQLQVPRLGSPRQHVPAGSVGIGAAQTGIYSQAGPGGWQLIGRTGLCLFDPAADPPTLLKPGDRLRFVAVSGGES